MIIPVINMNTNEIKLSINGNSFLTGSLDFSNVTLFSDQSYISVLSKSLTAQNELQSSNVYLYNREVTIDDIKKLYNTKL